MTFRATSGLDWLTRLFQLKTFNTNCAAASNADEVAAQHATNVSLASPWGISEMTLSKCIAAVLCVGLFGFYSVPAFAYLDPGTGSMLIQGLIGAIAAAALTVKLYWHKVKALFRSKKNGDSSAAGTPPRGEADQ